MKLRYGFKKEAEAKALALRREVGAGPLDPVDVFKIANYLGAIVVSLSELRTDGARAESIYHFHSVEPKAFSALTVQRGERSLIIYNEVHAQGRIANSLAHESSHLALKHERPSGVVMGCRQWDGNQEGEADWLGGCILVPAQAACWVVQQGMTLARAAEHFGVSQQLMRMRLNLTGATKIENSNLPRRGA